MLIFSYIFNPDLDLKNSKKWDFVTFGIENKLLCSKTLMVLIAQQVKIWLASFSTASNASCVVLVSVICIQWFMAWHNFSHCGHPLGIWIIIPVILDPAGHVEKLGLYKWASHGLACWSRIGAYHGGNFALMQNHDLFRPPSVDSYDILIQPEVF